MNHIIFSKMNLGNKTRYKPKRNIKFVVPSKDNYSNSIKIKAQLENQIKETQEKAEQFKFNPYLVMKIELEDDCVLTDKEEEKLEFFGVKIIDKESKQVEIVFSSDLNLVNFTTALEEYKNGEIANTKIKHNDLFCKIKNIGPWSKEDRINCNVDEVQRIGYFDCYLWVFDTIEESKKMMSEFEEYVKSLQMGNVTDKYVGSSVVVARIKISNIELIDQLANNPLVFQIEEIEKVNMLTSESRKAKETTVDEIDFDTSKMNGENASICVIDSGIYKQHPLFQKVIGEGKTFYCTDDYQFSDNDFDGHGTAVASICEYGDFSYKQKFIPEIYIHSAKIHDGAYTNPIVLWEKDLEKNIGELTSDEKIAIGDFSNSQLSLDEALSYFRKEIQPYARMAYSRYSSMYETLIPTQMKLIVEYFYKTYKCRIFNLSQGDKNQVYLGGKPKAWSCVLDELQNIYDIIFVVSSGNFTYEDIDEYKNILSEYPEYLYKKNNCKIIEPSDSVTSLTVGGLAINDKIESANVGLLDEKSITKKDYISSLTRVGPGVLKGIKPDFVAYSGDRGIKTLITGYSKPIKKDLLGKILFNNDIQGGLFRFDCGTSFAAPFVSHILATLINRYPKLSNNMLRAILVSSAGYNVTTINQLTALSQKITDINDEFVTKAGNNVNVYNKMLTYTLGYGFPDKRKCLESIDNRVVLMADMIEKEDLIKKDDIHIFKIPLLESFRKSKGTKRVIVSLAYNPPVKSTRLDYIGVNIGFDLIKGTDLKNVLLAFEHQEDRKMHKDIEKKYKCKLDVGSTLRGNGTLQKGIFEFSKNINFTDELYLVVNCKKKWANVSQKYAVCVILESDDIKLKMYDQMKNEISLQNSIRVKTRAKV